LEELTMTTLAPDRAGELIAEWLKGNEAVGLESPAGPLFAGGAYAEWEITMTGGGGSPFTTTACGYCTGSYTLECY
jgi:hypothetical protein